MEKRRITIQVMAKESYSSRMTSDKTSCIAEGVEEGGLIRSSINAASIVTSKEDSQTVQRSGVKDVGGAISGTR